MRQEYLKPQQNTPYRYAHDNVIRTLPYLKHDAIHHIVVPKLPYICNILLLLF